MDPKPPDLDRIGRPTPISTAITIGAVCLALYLSSLYSYILFHSLIEIITITIAFTLFIITWNARRFINNDPLKLIGVGYAFIALIDLLHTLAYKGMSVFPGYGANLPTQLWIGARYLQAFVLCVAPWFARRRLNDPLALGILSLSTAIVAGLIYGGGFPDCFVEGMGLTPFKIISEYIITGILIVAMVLFRREWRHSGDNIYPVIIASTACTIVSEISFTAYVSVYGFANLLGHYFKLAAFYLIYRAILATGIREPIDIFFGKLTRAYDRLRETNASLESEIEERTHAEDELRRARDELEMRVEARTAELRVANERLQEELVERELAEETTRKREEYIRRLVEESPVAMLVSSGAEQRIILLNRQFTELFGYTRDDIPDIAHWWGLAYPDERYRSEVMASWALLVGNIVTLGGETGAMEVMVTGKAGQQCFTEVRMSSIGEHCIVTFTDLTDRYRAAKNERLLSAIVQSSEDAIIAKDSGGTILSWNRGAERIYGYSAEEAIGRNVSMLLPAESADELRGIMEKILSGEPVEEYFTRRLRKDGEPIFVYVAISPLKDDLGRIIGAATIARDVTKIRQAEDELARQKKLLEVFFENSLTCNVILDRYFNFVRVNAAYARADNRRVEDFPGHNHFEFYPSDIRKLFEKVVAEKTPEEVFALPFVYPADPDRGVSYWDWSLVPTLDDGGEVDKLIFILRNVTGHVKATQVMQESRDRLMEQQRTLTSLLNSELFSGTDSLSTIQHLLEVSAERIGVERVSFWRFTPGRENLRCVDLYLHEAKIHDVEGGELAVDDFPAYFSALQTGELMVADDAHNHPQTREFSATYLTPLGIGSMLDAPVQLRGRVEGVICHEHVGAPVAWSPEQQLFAVAMSNLVSLALEQAERWQLEGEREHLQAQLFQAQKMEAIGQLAGGVAHDFNNILTAIIGFSTLMEMKMPVDDPQRANVSQILAAADRASELTRSLLAFSRKQVINPQPVDMNRIINQTSKFLQRIIGEDIELRLKLFEGALTVNADSTQIEQVLMNLATNARDVMPHGGILIIGSSLLSIGDNFIRAHGFGAPGEYVMVTVSDNGGGIDESVRKRIFEPFFTTKEVGRGTGLGLSIVYGIIKQHNGYINVYSEPGHGTTFTIYLPSIVEEAREKTESIKEVPVEGTETILVADDDVTLRQIAEDVFGHYGYTVITAENGEDALQKFRLNRDRVSLVILDVIMPKMNGKETYDEIRLIAPDCKVIFVSGYTDEIIYKRGLLDKGFVFMLKPLRPEKLLQKVRELLDGGSLE